jgi:hypothetical protein
MQTGRDSQGSIKSPNTVLEDYMEWIDVRVLGVQGLFVAANRKIWSRCSSGE